MDLGREELLRAYRSMKTIREFEERVNTEFLAGNIPGFLHLYAGQEAVAVGACENLADTDYISSTHRGHGHCIAKGCDVKGMMLEIMAKEGGLCGAKGGSMHIADINKGMLGANAIVGGGPPVTIGAALTQKTKKTGGVALCFTGDGGSNQGTTFEAMNLAVVLQLPMIFIFENNGYGEGTGVDYSVGASSIAERAAGFGMPTETVNGEDFFAVYAAVSRAVARAKAGEGPTSIEAQVKRFYGHFVGDAMAYRDKGEVDELRENHDCLKHFRQRVMVENLLSAEELDEVDAQVLTLIDASVTEGMAAPAPADSEITTDVYVSY